MTRGRKPLPTETKKLRGNPGKRQLNNAEPQYPAADTRLPRGRLPDQAARLWREIAPLLAENGVLKETDKTALELLCLHYQHAYDAQQGILEKGYVNKRGLERRHPYVNIFNDAASQFLRFAAEFGLTPSSRSRIKLEQPEEKSLADELFSMVKGGE